MNKVSRFNHRLIFGMLTAAILAAMVVWFTPDTFAQLEVQNKELLEGSGIEITKTFGETILTMVNYFVGFLGFLAVVVFIYAGVLWVLNMGNDELVTKAKKVMTYAVLGIVVIILSFSIVRFITSSAGGERREAGAGGECLYSIDCPDGQLCALDQASGERRCTEDIQSAFDRECRASADCPEENQICVGGQCATPGEIEQLNLECVNTEECNFGAGDVCWDNICQTPPDRPRAPFECLGSFHCQEGEYCAVGRCRAATNVTCTANADCEAPRTCDSGFCRNPNAGSGSTCTDNSDCPSGYVCNGSGHRCEFQGSGGTGATGVSSSTTIAASESHLSVIDDLLGQLGSSTANLSELLSQLPEENREEIQAALGEGAILDKVGRLEDLLDGEEDPEVVRVLERLINALSYLISVREEMDDLQEVMPESSEIIDLWNEASEILDELIDDPDSSVKLRRFEAKYRQLRDLVRRFPVVQARIHAVPGEGNVPFTVTLDALDSVDPTGGTLSDYRWSYLDNQGNEIALGNAPVIIHEFTEPNTYAVRLVASTSRRDENGYKTAADGMATLRVRANPPSSQVNFRINGVEASDVYRVTVKEAQAGIVFDPSGSVPALGRTITQYEWFFGDTATEIRTTPTSVVHGYVKAGEYFVKLVVTDSHGVKDQRIVKLFVKSLAADIGINPRQGNVNTQYQFQGIASRSDDGAIVNYSWVIEDSEGKVVLETDEQSFYQKFDRPGDYQVTLLVSDITGARDNAVEILKIISRKPVASFNHSVPQPNHPNRLEFDALSSYDPDEGDLIKYSWDFDGDGTFEIINSAESRVTYEYKRAGNYRARLQVQDGFGQRDLTEKSITIDSVLSGDIILARRAVQVGQEVEFKIESSEAVAYLWEFGDAQTMNTEAKTIKHTYSRTGRYTVKVHFFDQDDHENTDTATLLVGPSDTPVAVASFLVNDREFRIEKDLCGAGKSGISVSRSDNILFTGKDSINTDGSNRLLVYNWEFSDGTQKTKREFTHRFDELSPSNSCLEVSLVVRDEISGKVSPEDILYVKVINELPSITDFIIEAPHEEVLMTPATVTLRAVNPKDSDGTIKKYRWWYYREGDAEAKLGLHSTSGPETQMVITAVGEPEIKNRYFFVLEITDSDGGVWNTQERFAEVNYLDIENGPNLSPAVAFTLDKTTISTGDSVTFVSQSYDPQGDLLPNTAFRWDFDGDGQFDDISSGPQVNRQFNTPGEYEVRLKVTHRGLSSSATQKVYVEPTQSLPQAAFTYTVDGLSVTFDGNNSRFDPDLPDTTLRFEWDFDVQQDSDGNGVNDDDVDSTEVRPAHTYPEVRRYRARLRVKDMTGAEGVVVRDLDLTLSEAERTRNAYRSLGVSSPDQGLTSLKVDVTPGRLSRGGTADVLANVFNADNSPYFGKVYFEVIEGSGEFSPSPVEAKNNKASTVFTASDPGPVRLRVRATDTIFGDLTEEATLNVTP